MAQHTLVRRRTRAGRTTTRLAGRFSSSLGGAARGFHRRVVSVQRQVIYNVRRWRSGILITGGLGFISASAYALHTALGLLVTGIVLLVIEISTGEERK